MRSGLLAVILTAFAQAQEATVSMKIDLVSWGDAIKGLSLKTAESKGGLTAQSFRYSQPISYSGPAILEIYRGGSGAEEPVPEPTADDLAHQLMPLPPVEENTAAGDKKPEKTGLALELEKRRKKAPSLVALAALPSGCSRATVLLAPADGETYTSYVIDDDPSKLPPGQLRIHNLSPLDILVRCNGKQQKELKTRESFISPAENQQIIYELAYKAGDEWKMQENNIIPIRENEQTQMMILKSKNSFFQSTDGSSGGFLQIVTLRRGPSR